MAEAAVNRDLEVLCNSCGLFLYAAPILYIEVSAFPNFKENSEGGCVE